MTSLFQWVIKKGYAYKILNQPKQNRGGAHVRITHNGNVVDCWPGAKGVTHHVSGGVYYDSLGLNGLARVIENRPGEAEKRRRRPKKIKGES